MSTSLDLTDPTPLQRKLFRAYKTGLYAEFALDGPVRQGKTAGAAAILVDRIACDLASDMSYEYGAVGQTILALERNVAGYVEDAAYQYGMSFRDVGGSRPHWSVGGRPVHTFAGGTVGSYKSIRGATLHSGIVDEITVIDERAYDTFVERMSYGGGLIITTCNPDRPAHWYRQSVINAPPERRVLAMSVPWRDNQHYPDERADILESRDPTSAAYRRNVLGQWVNDSGVIFQFQPQHYLTELPGSHGICVMDEGLRGTQAALLFTPRADGSWLCAEEYYHRAAQKGIWTAKAHVDAILESWPTTITSWVVDPAAGTTKDELRRRGFHVVNANNDYLRGVDRINNALFAGKVFLSTRLHYLPMEADGYIWAEGGNRPVAPKGRPDRKLDHLCDCWRYAGGYLFPTGGFWE